MDENFKRNAIVSLVCGLLFGFSWWLMIDVCVMYGQVARFRKGLMFLPIVFSTISLIFNNMIPNSSLTEVDELTKRVLVHRIIFFLSTAIGFAGLLTAIILCIVHPASSLPMYGLVGVPVVNALILISNLGFKFGVVEDPGNFI